MKSKGFTIVEVLIVLFVIGILVALVMTTAKGIQERNKAKELPAYCTDANDWKCKE